MRTLRLVLCALALASTASAGTLVVGPGQHFTTIQSAIDAAVPGDVVRVLPGNYGPFTLNKPLRVLGAGSDLVNVSNASFPLGFDTMAMLIRDIPAGHEAMVSGMRVRGFSTAAFIVDDDFTARVLDCDGRVILHDLILEANPSSNALRGMLSIDSSGLVAVHASVVEGFVSELDSQQPLTIAVRATSSTIWVMGSTLEGGSNDTTLLFEATTEGGPALLLDGASAYVARSTLVGGDGGLDQSGSAGFCTAFHGFDGGDGIDARNGSTVKFAAGPGSSIQGGDITHGSVCPVSGGAGIRLSGGSQAILAEGAAVFGGTGITGTLSGDPNMPIDEAPVLALSGSSFGEIQGEYATLALATRFVPVGTGQTLMFDGKPFYVGLAFWAFASGGPTPVPGFDGMSGLHGPSTQFLKAFLLDALGERSLSFTIPNDPSLAGVVLHFQWIQTNGVNQGFSNPSVMRIVE